MNKLACLLVPLAGFSVALAGPNPAEGSKRFSSQEEVDRLKAELHDQAAAAGVELRDVSIRQDVALGDTTPEDADITEGDPIQDSDRGCRATADHPEMDGITVSVSEPDCRKVVSQLVEAMGADGK